MRHFEGWKKRVAIAMNILCFMTLLLSVERLVFDVLGEMWGTMLINGMTLLCSLVCITGVCIKEKLALILFIGWDVISIGLNLVVIFIYNDIGLFREKEHYLGLTIGNNNWWRTHGVGCSINATLSEDEGSAMESHAQECFLSYADTETIHAAVYLFLAVLTLGLSIALLWPRKKVHFPDDDESFSYIGVGQFYTYSRPFRNWSETTSNTTVW